MKEKPKVTKYDIAARLTLAKKDYWQGRMTAKEQRELFGAYLFGKKKFKVNCDNQGTVEGSFKVCFGHDFNTFKYTFAQIADAVNQGRDLRF